jgi:hypothetical protein
MNSHFRPTVLDHLPYNINRLIICGEYGWYDIYHSLLHSCYSQPDASYWFQAAFELWRNTAMLVILTTTVLFVFICMSLAANGIIWLITEGVKYAYNAVTATLHTPQPITLQCKSQNN